MRSHGNRQKHLNPNPIQRGLLNRFHNKIIRLIDQTEATRLFDVGCGEGFVLRHLREADPSLAMIGGDLDREALGWGRANLIHKAPLALLNVHHLPFPDNSFPITICLEVLEHLPDSTVGLRELARVSSKYVLLSVPHEPWFRWANLLRGKHVLSLGNDPEHLHNYTSQTFGQMVSSVIDIVQREYSFPWQIALGRKRE